MILYLAGRVSLLLFTLFMLSLVSFVLAYLFPGDPLSNLSGINSLTPDIYTGLMDKYQVHQNIFWQYWHYLTLLLQGDWGLSFSSGQPVFQEVWAHLPASLELSIYALFVSLSIGIPLGFIAGLNHKKNIDYGLSALGLLGYSLPVFWLALLMISFFALKLGWFPISGRLSLLYNIPVESGFLLWDIFIASVDNKSAIYQDAFSHLILPTISLSIVTSTLIIRVTRRSVINVMSSDYIKAAYAKGLSHWQVIWRHGLRNILMPLMPQLAMQFTVLLTNAMVVEVIFSWPGIGNWLLQAIYQQDFPAIRAGMLMVSALVVIFTLSIDMLLRISDPQRDREVHGSI